MSKSKTLFLFVLKNMYSIRAATYSSISMRVACLYVFTVSDGASQASMKRSSAAWALLAFSPNQINLIAGGAVMFDTYVSSMEAELAGLELAAGALLKLSRGYRDVVPHSIQTTLDISEFELSYRHLWSVSL